MADMPVSADNNNPLSNSIEYTVPKIVFEVVGVGGHIEEKLVHFQ